MGRVALDDVDVRDGKRRRAVKLDGELDAGVVVGRDLGPVDVVEREHRVRVVGVQPDGERVGAAVHEPGHVVHVLGVGALQGAVPGDLAAVDPQVRLADDPVDDEARVRGRPCAERRAEPPRHREARDRVRADATSCSRSSASGWWRRRRWGSARSGRAPPPRSREPRHRRARPSASPWRRIPGATRRRRHCRPTRCSAPASRAGRRSGWRRRQPGDGRAGPGPAGPGRQARRPAADGYGHDDTRVHS